MKINHFFAKFESLSGKKYISAPKGIFELMIFLFAFGGIWTRSVEGFGRGLC